MKTLILAGGKGTRFMEESRHMPKPMIPINGKPMIFHIISQYKKFNFNDFVILGGIKVDYIIDYFDRNFKKINSKEYLYQTSEKTNIQILDTGEETMTGGRVKQAVEKLQIEEFLLTYGDGFCDVDINLVIKKFRDTKTIATVTAVRPPARFGSLEIKGDLIKSFGEKNQTKEGWINGGFFVMNSKIIDFISSNSMPLEKEPLETLSAKNQLSVHKHFGFFQPVDTLREKELLEKYLIENNGY